MLSIWVSWGCYGLEYGYWLCWLDPGRAAIGHYHDTARRVRWQWKCGVMDWSEQTVNDSSLPVWRLTRRDETPATRTDWQLVTDRQEDRLTDRLSSLIIPVFFNLFWRGTLCINFDCSRNPWAQPGMSWESQGAEIQEGKGFLGRRQRAPPHQLVGLGERCMSAGAFLMHQHPENASIGHKCRLVPVSRFDAVELLDVTCGTLRFHGTPVEKHWIIEAHDSLSISEY